MKAYNDRRRQKRTKGPARGKTTPCGSTRDNTGGSGTDPVGPGAAATWVHRLVFRAVDEVAAEAGSAATEAAIASPSGVDLTSTARTDHSHEPCEQTSRADIRPTQEQPRTCAVGDPGSSISIVSWNVLAEAYCSPRSHVRLPPRYRKRVFDPEARRRLLCNTLSRLADLAEVLVLQEVDLPDVARHLARRHGWVGLETPRTKGGGAGGRCDSVAVFLDPRRWRIAEHELVRLDDLATRTVDRGEACRGAADCGALKKDHGKEPPSSDQPPLLQGFQQSFLRRNVALLVRLRSQIDPERTVVIATAHLYWHPGYEYVKLCQIHYVLQRAERFCQRRFETEPLIVCGDLNSRPEGAAYHYLTRGTINAKLVAPWFQQVPIGEAALVPSTPSEIIQGNGIKFETSASKTPGEQQNEISGSHKTIDDVNGLAEDLDRCFSLHDNLQHGISITKPSLGVKYMLDNTLNKFCRWLRILGQDAALETDAQEKLRTRDGVYSIFQQCQEERRTLVTTSRRMVQRRDCPPGTYWLSPTLTNNLELALVHLLLSHGVVLQPSHFLTRCVVCNGAILQVPDLMQKRLILQSYAAPDLGDEMEVYQCSGCQQGYWWCDQPNSSASRVKDAAAHLFRQCLRAGVPCSSNLGMFDFVNVEAEQEQGWDNNLPGSEVLQQQLEVIGWLRNEKLDCPVRVQSAYAKRTDLGEAQPAEMLPFTNVTASFVNVLDYIFYNHTLRVTQLLSIPRTFAELNAYGIPNGHLLPSDIWPSDHLAIGATFVFENAK